MMDEASGSAAAKAGLGEVRVRVKSASHRCEDIEISCQLDSNVRQVKQLIKEQYPLHPEIEEQRIIYAGHLLEDKQVLNDVFLPSGQMSSTGGYTLHLACNSTFLRKAANKAMSDSEEAKKSVPPPGNAAQPQPQIPTMAAGIPQDFLAMHQQYVQQMMAFMAEWQWNHGYAYGMPQSQGVWLNPTQMGPQMTMPGMSVNMNPQVPPYMNMNPQMPPNMNLNMHPQVPPNINVNPGVPLNMNQPPPAAAPVPQPPVQNPAGDDEPPRDILDWMYTFSRAALILSVVYFYSNFTRFVLVLIFTALVMLIQRRPDLLNGLRPNNNNAVPPRPADAPGGPRPANNNPEPGNEGVARDPGSANVNRAPEQEGADTEQNSDSAEPSAVDGLIPEAQPPPVPRYNPFDVTRTFLMTFFTSLIPEMQQN